MYVIVTVCCFSYSKYISDLMPIWLTDVRCTTTTTTDEDGNTETHVNEVKTPGAQRSQLFL